MTATATMSANPTPTVDLNVTSVTGVTVTVTRSWGGSAQTVRGANRTAVTGSSMFFQDAEAPFGVPITYTLDSFDVNGGIIGSQSAAPITVAVVVPWISDPLDPAQARAVALGAGALMNLTRDRPGDIVGIQLSPDRVAAVGPRRNYSEIPLSFLFESEAVAAALDAVLTQADPFLLRTPPGLPGARLMYLSAPVFAQRTLKARDGLMVGEVILTGAAMVRAPGADVVKPTRSYAAVQTGQTYSSAAGQWASYLIAQRGY